MKKLLLLIFLISAFPPISHAQINIPTGPSGNGFTNNLPNELIITVSPELPKPGQLVSFHLEMYTENLDTAQISWYVNNKLTKQGMGMKEFTTIAPKEKERMLVGVVINLSNGVSFRKETFVTPTSLDLVWEADSYTPPFYKGKALFPPQGKIKILAISNSNWPVYKWTVNGEVLQNISGYSKNAAIVSGSILGKTTEIEVEASDPSSGTSAKSTLFIDGTSPNILFYENNPLYGVMYNQALTNINLDREEVTVFAVPYNLSSENINNSSYKWRINGIQAEGVTGRSAVFRKPNGVSGKSNITLGVENTRKPLQIFQGAFSINFEN